MSSSIFGAEQRIIEPLSALAFLTGRHREEKTPRPNFSLVKSHRVNEINDRLLYLLRENLGVNHESRPKNPNLGVSDRVRLHVVFVCAVHPATSAVLAVVGDGRSGDPLHERGDKRDVYEGEVAKVDSVSELVRRVAGVVDGLRPLVDVARGSVGGVCGDVFEEVEELFAHPSVRIHHERDEFLMHRTRASAAP